MKVLKYIFIMQLGLVNNFFCTQMNDPFNRNANNITSDSYNKAKMEEDFQKIQKINEMLDKLPEVNQKNQDEREKIKQVKEEVEKLQKDAESWGIGTKLVNLGIIALLVLAFTVWRDLSNIS